MIIDAAALRYFLMLPLLIDAATLPFIDATPPPAADAMMPCAVTLFLLADAPPRRRG